jgi:hypothetical protein
LAFFLPCFPFFTEFTGYQLSSQYLVSHLRPSVLEKCSCGIAAGAG